MHTYSYMKKICERATNVNLSSLSSLVICSEFSISILFRSHSRRYLSLLALSAFFFAINIEFVEPIQECLPRACYVCATCRLIIYLTRHRIHTYHEFEYHRNECYFSWQREREKKKAEHMHVLLGKIRIEVRTVYRKKFGKLSAFL
jgi:hypothetical protein